ncbi:TonB-dependent siderophore receptor [Acidovorax sp. 1608163]|uniref:TonB-dependent receptor n=1 Tax=Acidovorax sp. 1608163 TaxID=2478662 RepID=UPI000EF6E8FC|nr:TonB-dependent siderophore receptor [Acidovorax sp. 1608163]AYM94881.1 TonB-dependent siderophore receptor [Acidovorax sp. 1608163]
MAIDSSTGSKAARFPLGRMGAALLVGFGSWGGQALAQDTLRTAAELPAVQVTGAQYDPDDVRPEGVTTATKTYMAPKDIPQTIDTLEVNKYKSYGINDLATMLDGVPGVNTSYDMRGEGVMIRGFAADSGDIYRDGVRESGQVRRSTANVERIEILKGPASVLYGRSAGGGVINMVSKQARFDAKSSLTLRGGSWDNYGGTLDINKVINPNVAVRVTADREQAHSFRSGIRNKNEMVSPSITVDTRTGLRWTGQYTYDNVWRVPDRGPAYDQLPAGVSIRQGFAQPGDYVEDRLRVLRSDLSYDFNAAWSLRWVASKREASQDFDHYFAGTYCNAQGRTSAGVACANPGRVRQSYAWQQTSNKTTNHTLDLTGRVDLAGMRHELLVGLEHSEEVRNPRLFSTANSNGSIDPFNPVLNAVRPVQGAPSQQNLHEAQAKALYAQDLIHLAPQWKLLLGGRYDSFDFTTLNQLSGVQRSSSGDSVSPRVGLVWQPVRDHSLYTSYSKSFSPYGGRGLLGVSVVPNAVFDAEPQHSRQMEAGIKSDWLDGKLSTQLAVYQLEHYNIRYQPEPVNNPLLYMVRGKERSRGIEWSAAGRLAPSWYVRGGVGLMSAKVVEDRSVPANEGKNLRDTAKRNGNLFVRYAPDGAWYGELGVTHTSSRYTNEANTTRLPGYTRWDALVGWRAAPWSATLALSNLLDKEYWRSSSMPGAPRSVLLSVNYQF